MEAIKHAVDELSIPPERGKKKPCSPLRRR
jgi:hypothetical protein